MKSKIYSLVRLLLLFFSCLLFLNENVRSQTLINELWEIQLNYPDTVPWSASVITSSSDVITTGNTWHNATQKVNIVTTKTNSSGTVIWSTEYNGTLSGFDYGSAITIDGSGNIFVAGATHNTSAYTFDIVVIKYNSSGTQQWATLFNGSGSGMDIPSGITLDGSGNIYVCGASTGSTTGYDYVTIKLNPSGTTQWTQTYDYANLSDLPGYIEWSSANSKIGIAGASQSSATNWDYTLIKYNSSGTLTNTNRTSTTGYGFDRPTGLVTDAADNLYVTGYAYNGTDYDMRTIKLDEDLSPLWTVTEDDGDEDGSNGIAIDGSSNTYIAGFAVSSAGNKLMKIVKYNSAGSLQWEQTLQNVNNTVNAEAVGVSYNSSNSTLTVTGFYEYTTGIKVITTFGLNPSNGNVVWQKNYPNVHASIDRPTRVHTSGNHIWVFGTRIEDDTSRYITIKYETYERIEEDVLDEDDRPIYVDRQLLVSFDPEVVDLEFVNNRQLQFANLEDVIDEELYDDIAPLLDGEGQFTIKALKVYRRLTANDTLTITRLGDTIPIPKFWSTLLLIINVDPLEVLDTLNNKDEIEYADLNSIFLLDYVPDDDLLEDQLSLSDFPGGDVDMEDAWDIQMGRTNVKVGVYDVGVFWNHEDFHFSTGDATFEDSKIEGGWDWDHDHHVSVDDNDSDNSYWHGTAVAGILGAITDNDLGIAGAAGGSHNTGDINSTGVQLFDMEIGRDDIVFGLDNKIDEDYAADAILEGASYTPDGSYGYGLNVMNHSWGSKTGGGDMITVGNNIRFAFYNNVVVVCSKGNDESDKTHFPSDFRDLYILSVGGSGVDGNWDDGADVIDNDGSNFGNGVDLVAPYGFDIPVISLDNTGSDDYFPGFSLTGTSFSSPHVSGTAALMLSEVNHSDGAPHFENLTAEDVEHILEITADDNDEFGAGYDDHTGWGLLDAGEALELVNRPQYKIVHVCNEYDVSSIDPDEEDIYLDLVAAGPYYGLAAGAYVADRYEATFTSNHTLSPTAEIIGNWILPSISNPLAYAEGGIALTDDPFFTMTTPSLTSTEVTGYFYFVKAPWPGIGGAVNTWIPFDPATTKAKFCYSLHVFDEEAVDEIEVVVVSETTTLSLYPNPTSSISYLVIAGQSSGEISYSIANIAGQVVDVKSGILLNDGVNNVIVDFKDLTSGIYTLTVFNSSFTYSFKVVRL